MVRTENLSNKGKKVIFEGEELEIVGDIGAIITAFNQEYGTIKTLKLINANLNKIETDLNIHIIEIN